MRNLEGLVKAHALQLQQTDQLRDGDDRVRIVELNGGVHRKAAQVVAVDLLIALDDILQRRGAEEILLLEAQHLALVAVVVGIEHLGDIIGLVALAHRIEVVLIVELRKVEVGQRFGLPQAQGADVLGSVADHRHVIGHCPDLLAGELDELTVLLAADAPRIAEMRPVVRLLALEAVFDGLLEQAVLILDAVAVQRNVVRSSGIKEARGQAAQTAVAQRGVLHVFKRGDVQSVLFEDGLDLVQQPQLKEVVVDHAAHQELRREIIRAAMRGVRLAGIRPLVAHRAHDGLAQHHVQLMHIELLKLLAVFRLGDAHHILLQLALLFLSGGQAAVGLGDPAQAQRTRFSSFAGLHAPLPVSAQRGGGVHARPAAQLQHILHRSDAKIRHSGVDGTDHAPGIAFLGRKVRILGGKAALALRGIGKPALGGVVVVGAGVDDVVIGIKMGQIDALAAVVERELEHLHAGVARSLEELGHAGGDQAEVFGDDRHVAQTRPDGVEQIHARAFQPIADDGVLGRIRDGIIFVKAAEVVDAGHVVELGSRRDAVDPPLVAGGLEVLPVIQRVAPQLAGRGEIVRRAARHADGMALLVQPEHLGVGPGVRAVHGDINRNVAKELDAQGIDVAAELLPLLIEQILKEFVEADVLVQIAAVGADGIGVAQADALILPLGPGAHAEGLLHRHIQRVVFQPGAVFADEVVEIGQIALLRVVERDAQHPEAQLIDAGVIDVLGIIAPV